MDTYKTRKDAQEVIDKLDAQTYYLAHGEYERPNYKARKVRGKDLFYIYAGYYFYQGTLYAKQDGALTL